VSALAFPHGPEGAGRARRRLGQELDALGVPPECVADAELCLSELVGNAVRHGRPLPDGCLHAEWQIGPSVVRLAVLDGGEDASILNARHAGTDATSGRGLTIVGAIARRWGAEADPLGIRVWADVTLGRLRPPIVADGGR